MRDLLKEHSDGFAVADDTPRRYRLEAPIGPATLRAWGGKAKSQTIPVPWVDIGKTYVSYHLMGAAGNDKIKLSELLRARMQGKTCFNFKDVDDVAFSELGRVTEETLRALRAAGYVSTA